MYRYSLHLATDKKNIVATSRNSYVLYMGILESIQQTLVTIIFSGMLERFPRLKGVSSTEHDIGWIAYFIRRLDRAYAPGFAGPNPRPSRLVPPSEYFKRQVYATRFQDDPVGLATCVV